MWNKRIIVTNHAKQRFEQRNIRFSKDESNPIYQMLFDLRPLNVRKREKLKDDDYKITTQQGKVYIITEYHDVCFVKTVYKTNLMYENETIRMEMKRENEKNRRNNRKNRNSSFR